jgi:transketolase
MRKAFVETLVELADADGRLLLLTGDLGYTVVEPFARRFPGRFFNVGVAEQNMIGVATGLADAGFVPFVYSIATFASLRPYEFIRNGPVLHRLPVRVVGVGGGFDYGPQGATHHALEDIALMRVHPGLTVIAPADHQQARTALRATWSLPGPVYYRLGRDDAATVPGLGGEFGLGRLQRIRAGGDLAFVATGPVALEAAAAADALTRHGVHATVLVVASLNPAPVADLADALARLPLAVTVEAHYVAGGLGSLVAEVVAERGLACLVVRRGVTTPPDSVGGSTAYLHHRHGLSRDALVETALRALPRMAT